MSKQKTKQVLCVKEEKKQMRKAGISQADVSP